MDKWKHFTQEYTDVICFVSIFFYFPIFIFLFAGPTIGLSQYTVNFSQVDIGMEVVKPIDIINKCDIDACYQVSVGFFFITHHNSDISIHSCQKGQLVGHRVSQATGPDIVQFFNPTPDTEAKKWSTSDIPTNSLTLNFP